MRGYAQFDDMWSALPIGMRQNGFHVLNVRFQKQGKTEILLPWRFRYDSWE